MSFKQYFPVIFILVTAGVILGAFLLAGGEDDTRAIHAVALAHVRQMRGAAGEVEGRDFQIGAIETVGGIAPAGTLVAVEVKPQSFYIFLNIVRDREWKVKEDLSDLFATFWQQAESRKPFLDRLGHRLAERWNMGVNLHDDTTSYAYMLARDDKDVVANVEFRYRIPRNDGKFSHGRYLEKFRFKDKTWVSDGLGSIFDAVEK